MAKLDNKKKAGIVVGVALAALVALLVVQMHGTTTVVGEYPEAITDTALSCTHSSMSYPIFTYDRSDSKSTKVNVLFHGETVKSISLTHSLYYSDESYVTGSEAHNHAAMNIDFGKYGLGADAFNANYARLSDRMTMTLYTSDIDTDAAKYFLITINDDGALPQTLAEYQRNYSNQGFECEIVE